MSFIIFIYRPDFCNPFPFLFDFFLCKYLDSIANLLNNLRGRIDKALVLVLLILLVLTVLPVLLVLLVLLIPSHLLLIIAGVQSGLTSCRGGGKGRPESTHWPGNFPLENKNIRIFSRNEDQCDDKRIAPNDDTSIANIS